MANLPSKVSYGTVTGTFISAEIDSADADQNPDAVYIGGKVTFKPSAASIIDAYDKAIILPKPIVATIDVADGVLKGPDGTAGINLIATDSTYLNPVDFTWNASFTFDDGSSLAGFNFQLATGQTLDLSEVIPLDTSGGVLTIKGDKGDTGFFNGSETRVDLGDLTGAVNVDLEQGSAFTCRLIGNTVLTFINAKAGKVNYVTMRVKQDATGGRTLDVSGRQGAAGVNALANMSATGNTTDQVHFETWDDGAHWTAALTMQAIS